MSADYKPGTLAVATVRGQEFRVLRTADGDWFNGVGTLYADQVSDVRPLVVLDLSRKQVQEFAQWLRNQSKAVGSLIERVADEIEAQIKPPKPPEPQGLGAVVEDSKGHRWVRNPVTATDELPWWRSDLGGPYPYAELDVVRVLSEGVQP